MNGELAQSIALVAHGNAYLSDLDAAPPSLEAGNSVFRYVGSIAFRLLGGATLTGTAAWYEELRRQGVERLSLRVPAVDPALTVFANRLQGILVAGRADGQEWVAHNTVHDEHAPDRRIWAVLYSPHDATGEPGLDASSLDAASDELRAAIDAAETLARTTDELVGFGEPLSAARDLLAAGASSRAQRDDDMLPPRGYGLHARQLVAGAKRAWVFGGMGSWNDMRPPQGPRRDAYELITRRLFDSVVGALVCATNSFGAALDGPAA